MPQLSVRFALPQQRGPVPACGVRATPIGVLVRQHHCQRALTPAPAALVAQQLHQVSQGRTRSVQQEDPPHDRRGGRVNPDTVGGLAVPI